MSVNVAKELAQIEAMTMAGLRKKYAEVFGERTRSGNRTWLQRRILWRIQADAEGGLSERARKRADELANDADIRLSHPKKQQQHIAPAVSATLQVRTDDRLPPPGSVLTRDYKGRRLRVKVLPNGFEFEGDVYKSLSAVAKVVTGAHYNGWLFFRLTQKGGAGE